jgi:hypothetical protein
MEDIMAICELSDTCPFFNEKPSDQIQVKKILRFEYCISDFTKCARHQTALSHGLEKIPYNLLPDGYIEADFYVRNVPLKFDKKVR